MNLNDIPTPESDEVFGPKVFGTRSRVCRDLERRLTIARTALEAITHDMHASQMIHDLRIQTLKLTAPPEQ